MSGGTRGRRLKQCKQVLTTVILVSLVTLGTLFSMDVLIQYSGHNNSPREGLGIKLAKI